MHTQQLSCVVTVVAAREDPNADITPNYLITKITDQTRQEREKRGPNSTKPHWE